MIRISTRSSARQAQFGPNNLQRRETKPATVFSDDSDSDSSGALKSFPSTCESDDSDSDYCSVKSSRKSVVRKGAARETRRRITRSQKPSTDQIRYSRSVTPSKEHVIKEIKSVTKTGECVDDYDEYKSIRDKKPSTPRKQKLQNSHFECEDTNVSPSKQKKVSNSSLPQTPQHRKIYQNEVQTPSHLFVKLQLISPKHSKEVTPSRKQLFNDSDEKHYLAENIEFVDENPKKALSIYQNARIALHSTYPTDMPGREKELNELKEFIDTHIKNKTSGSLYVSGPPGTGKSASLNFILQEQNVSSKLQTVYVNCTAIKSPRAIFSRIAKELGMKISGKTEKDYSTGVENYLKRQGKMIMLVLDEIDQLENKNQTVLYTIFEWPSKPNTKLILVGIANALDLTDRTLPRLQAHCELKPKLLHFPPYTKQQIVQIFMSRLKSAGVLDVFSPVALQMLAGKVAAVSGDVRRALDIGRRVVELVERSKKEETLKSVENLANDLVDEKLKAVDLKQVVDVLNNVYGTSQSLSENTDESFPLQQKIVICSLLLMLKKAKNKDVTVGRLHEVYKRVCTKRNILSVDQAEFVGLCSLIETRGIVRVAGKKEPRLQKVNLVWDEEEVAASLKDKQLMSSILQDDSCLGKM